MHDYGWWLVMEMDWRWLSVNYDHDCLWSLMIIMAYSWRWHGHYRWRLIVIMIDKGRWSCTVIDDNVCRWLWWSLLMIIITNLFIINMMADRLLVVVVMDDNYDFWRLLDYCYWLMMMIIMSGDWLLIYHDWKWWTMDDNWLSDWPIDCLIDYKNTITRSIIITTDSGAL